MVKKSTQSAQPIKGKSAGKAKKPGTSAKPKPKAELMPQAAAIELQKQAFIKALHSNGGNVSEALRTSKLSRRTAYDHLNSDRDFKQLWHEAIEIEGDAIAAEVRRRAMHGKAVYSKPAKGKRARILRYEGASDRMLIHLDRKHEGQKKWRQRLKDVGQAALRAVRESSKDLGLTEDQIIGVEDAILKNFEGISTL